MSDNSDVDGKVPDLRFPEFRDAPEWEPASLGTKVTKVGSGITPKGGDTNYKKGGRPFLRSQNIGWGHLILDDMAFIDEDMHSTFLATEIKEHDVFLNITGASIGRSAVASAQVEGGNVNQHVCIIRTKQPQLNPYFLSQYLLSQYGQTQIDSFQAGGNRQGLNFAQVRSFLISLPINGEQKKIADCLLAIDEVIAAQTRKLDALKTHRHGLMQQLFPAEGESVPKLRFPEFRDVGEWKKQKISRLFKRVSNPVSVDSNEMYRQIGIRSHGKGIFHKEGVSGKALAQKKVFWVEEDAFVVNIVFAWKRAVATTSSSEKGMIASHRFPMYKAIPNRSDVRYLLYFFLTKTGKDLLWLASPGGAGRNKTLGQKEFEQLEFLFPERVEEQTRIAGCLSSIDDLVTAQTQKIESLKAHKKGLMQQLFPSADEAQG